MGNTNECDRHTLDLNRNNGVIKHRPRCTHPGAQHGPVIGRLMMGMVFGVSDGLCLSQPAYGQDTEHKDDRQDF
jgi:hypothetical protein